MNKLKQYKKLVYFVCVCGGGGGGGGGYFIVLTFYLCGTQDISGP